MSAQDVNQGAEAEAKPAQEQPAAQAEGNNEVAALTQSVKRLEGLFGSMSGTIQELQSKSVTPAPEAKAKPKDGEHSIDNPALAAEVNKLKTETERLVAREAKQKEDAKRIEVAKAMEANGLNPEFATALAAQWSPDLNVDDDLKVTHGNIPELAKSINDYVAEFANTSMGQAIKITPKVPGTKGVHGSAPDAEGSIKKVHASSDEYKTLTNEQLRSGKYEIIY